MKSLRNSDGLMEPENDVENDVEMEPGDVVNWMVEAQRNGAKMLKDAKS